MTDQTEKQEQKQKRYISPSIDYIFEEHPEESEELAALIRPIRKRFKYTIYYNAIFLAVSFKYIQNVNYYMKKFFSNRKKGLLNLIFISTLHSFAFCSLLIGGNCLILGVNPIKLMRKHKEITDRIIEKEGLDIDSITDVFKGPLKKIEESKVDGKTFKDSISKRV